MALRKTPMVVGEFYHIYNRGNHKREIFLDKNDYERFQRLLYLCNGSLPINVRDVRTSRTDFYKYQHGTPLVAIGAYCLMPNHFHLLATPLVEDGLSIFMKKIGTSYSMYFNKKYECNGSLFEGRYKSKHSGEDVYLKYLYAYIHLNPLKLIDSQWKSRGLFNTQEATSHLMSFSHSSLLDYLGQVRAEKAILTPSSFPDYFQSPGDHMKELFSWFSPRTDLGEKVF